MIFAWWLTFFFLNFFYYLLHPGNLKNLQYFTFLLLIAAMHVKMIKQEVNFFLFVLAPNSYSSIMNRDHAMTDSIESI